MDIFLGSKRVNGIYKGDKAIHGIMVDDKLYPGGMGASLYWYPSNDSNLFPMSAGRKAYYNYIVSNGYGITIGGTHAYNTTVLSGALLAVSGFKDSDWTLDPVIGSAVNTMVASGGLVRVGEYGIANHTVISSGGSMVVSSGGTAYNVTSKTGAKITVENGGYITYT